MNQQSRPLRFVDLVVGRHYLSPSGRLCRMLAWTENGRRNAIVFEYCDERAKKEREPIFHLAIDNLKAVEAMREVFV